MVRQLLLSEARSLLPVRRALVIAVLFVPWMQLGLTLVLNREELSGHFWAFYVYSAIYAVTAAVTSQRGFALTGPLLPLLLMVAPWFLSGPSWVNVNVAAVAMVVLSSIVLVPVAAAVVCILVSVLFLLTIHADLPATLTTGAFLGGGVFHVIQLLAATGVASYSWYQLNERALQQDNAMHAAQRDVAAMRARQDRLAHWRRVSSRLQTSVLDLISRAHVSGATEELDLRGELTDLYRSRSLQNPLPRVVVGDVAADFAGRLTVEFVSDSTTAELTTDMVSAELLRDATFEFCVAARHAGATRVVVHAQAFNDRNVYVLIDDAPRSGPTSGPSADFGLIHDRIRSAGASLALRHDDDEHLSLTLVIPIPKPAVVVAPTHDFRWGLPTAGERMVAAIMLAIMISGLVVASVLLYWWPGAYLLAITWAVMCSASIAVFFLSPVRLNFWMSLVLGSLAVVVMGLLTSYAPACDVVLPLHYIANSTGYALLLTFMIGNRIAAAMSFVPWLIATVGFVQVLPDECESIAWYAIANTLILVPFGLLVWFASARAFRLTQQRSLEIQRVRDEAADRDAMVHDIVADIEALLERANSILLALSKAPQDPTLLHQLKVVESQLRIRAQVDPLVAGATARTLIQFVDVIASRGHWIEIGNIASSHYQRALPEEVLEAAMNIGGILGSGRKLNFFTTEQDEIVSHTLTRAEADQIADLLQGWDMTNSGWSCADVQVDLDLASSEDAQAPVMIVWSRPISRVPGLGIPDRRSYARA